MHILKRNVHCCDLVPFQVIQLRFYASKNYIDVLKRDSEVHELVSGKSKPKQNFLSVFGVAGTGALGIKRMINNEREKGNLVVARKAYPFYYFNYKDGVKASIKNVACGYGFTLFSGRGKLNWEVYGCGINNDSQLSLQDAPLDGQNNQVIMEPRVIKLPSKMDKIRNIACGRAHSIVVGDVDSSATDTQIIYSFGNNLFGQCGRQIIENEIFFKNSIINRIALPKRVKQVECGELSTHFLTEDGIIYGCGSNICGQLANRDVDRSSDLIEVRGPLSGEVVKQISSRSNTVLALTEKGAVWAWGDNEHGLVFEETDYASVSQPTLLKMPATVGKIVQVCAGKTVCAVVDEQGRVHTWGQDLLGLGPRTQAVQQPTIIPPGLFGAGLQALDGTCSTVVSVQCGLTHCTAITSSGCLFFWGQTAPSRNGSQTFPIRMPITFNAKRAFIGADHSVIMGSTDM